MKKRDAAFWIKTLGLAPHPEGGFYREVYRAAEAIPRRGLPKRYAAPRPFSTSIYYLLRAGDVSRFHRLRSDEVWHFYDGRPILLHLLGDDGGHRIVRLGRDATAGETFQAVVPAGRWFGAEVKGRTGYSLVGCTLAPGFDFADFELARREKLLKAFPARAALVGRLTR
jgi:hypothetical protein